MWSGASLRLAGTTWALAAFAAGLVSGTLWLGSQAAWNLYLERAYASGLRTFFAVQTRSPAPPGIAIRRLGRTASDAAEAGAFARIEGTPRPARVTNVTIREDMPAGISREVMLLAIVSDELHYPVADLESREGLAPAEKLGNITQLLATYCGDAVMITRSRQGDWFGIEGEGVWGCGAAPSDMRLPAILLALLILGGVLTSVTDVAQQFRAFADTLRTRRRLGGPGSYAIEGPAELRDMVGAINSYLEQERAQLMNRATVLSGVSHDLGTPATRLRLRATLIENQALKEKLNADIDQMTGMIESVLTYTRSEMNVEEPRQISLTALVESLVANYQDVGLSVELAATAPELVEGGASVFMSRRGHALLPDARRILVTARPMSLERAISNLIENAIKYGRRATVSLCATSDTATVTIEDEGGSHSLEAIERLVAPFRRGSEAGGGYGLGLTIAAAVAEQHAGRLSFDQGPHGLLVRLTIQRT